MQVGFGAFVHLVMLRALLAPAALPTLALMADLPGGYDVFPLDARRALGILARGIAAGRQVDLVTLVFAAAIEFGRLRRIELPGDFLGLLEGARGVGLYKWSGQ
ncbi:hypothetical protein D3C81_1715340 [compost metagenome]